MNNTIYPVSIGRQRGFSLIELMTVLALLAIMLVLVSPSLSDWQRNQHIRGTAETLQSAIQKARAEAITRNRPTSFWLVTTATAGVLDNGCALTSTNSAWVISVHSPVGNCLAPASASQHPLMVDAQAGSAHVAVAAFEGTGSRAANVIRFDSYGRVMPSAEGTGPIGRIDIKALSDMDNTDRSDQFRSLRLTISNSGATRLCDPALPQASADPRRCLS